MRTFFSWIPFLRRKPQDPPSPSVVRPSEEHWAWTTSMSRNRLLAKAEIDTLTRQVAIHEPNRSLTYVDDPQRGEFLSFHADGAPHTFMKVYLSLGKPTKVELYTPDNPLPDSVGKLGLVDEEICMTLTGHLRALLVDATLASGSL